MKIYNIRQIQSKTVGANPGIFRGIDAARHLLKGPGMRIPVVIEPAPRSRRVRAYCPDLPGCSAVAESEPEALELVRTRIVEYFARGDRRTTPGTRITAIEI